MKVADRSIPAARGRGRNFRLAVVHTGEPKQQWRRKFGGGGEHAVDDDTVEVQVRIEAGAKVIEEDQRASRCGPRQRFRKSPRGREPRAHVGHCVVIVPRKARVFLGNE